MYVCSCFMLSELLVLAGVCNMMICRMWMLCLAVQMSVRCNSNYFTVTAGCVVKR